MPHRLINIGIYILLKNIKHYSYFHFYIFKQKNQLLIMYSREQQNRSYFAQGDTRQNYTNYPPHHHRPQTPLASVTANTQHFQSLNRSYGKLPSQPHSYAPQGQHRPNISRSRMSMGSSCASDLNNMMADHTDIFPQDLVFLLSNEQKNINNIKQKIEKEKAKVQNDFAIFRTEIDHILEDVKISVQAELDLVYKVYITKYAELKGEVQELRLLRKQILMNNPNNYNNNFNHKNSVSNKDLISEIEKDAQHMRNFKVYGYLSELQKQKLEPISEIAEQLVFIGAAECPFYRYKELNIKLKEVKHNFGSFIKQVFDNLSDYVVSPQVLMERQKAQQENNRTVLKQFDFMDASKLKPFDTHYPVNVREEEGKFNMKKTNPKKLSKINSNQQGCLTNWCEDVRLNRLERVQTDHSDSILCIYFVGDKYVATGSKDTTINIYSLDGKKIRNLKGHQASICCLSSVKNINGDLFLASGSDHGCSSLILWDVRSWTIFSKAQVHAAAVTGILDLEDGCHVATGSYDKKINIFNTMKGQIVLSLQNNKTSVTGLVMNADKSRLISSGLDKSIIVWNIQRKKGVVQDIVSQKIINCNQLICQLQSSLLRPQLIFCAARDGSLRMLNIQSGREEKTFTVNANSLIELVAIQRQMNADAPILLTCSAKDSSLILTKMQSGISSLLKLPTNLGIDYGCGIGPKIVLSDNRDGLVAIVSQKSNSKQFSLYELDLK